MSDDPINGNGVSHDAAIAALELRQLESSVLLARARFAAQSGLTFNGARDEYTILGYDPIIQVQQYIDEYCRGGIAGSVVDVMPSATWRGQPAFELVEDEDPEVKTEFEKAWDALEQRLQIGSKLLRTDKLSRLSTYAILVIGDGGSLEEPLKKAKGPDSLKYLRPVLGAGGPNSSTYSRTATDWSASATIFEYDVDGKSARFGLPSSYQIRDLNITSPVLARPVHWSRVVHVAEGLLLDDVFGQPALERVWNLLIDLRKVTGGGSEAFWLRANQGLHLDIDKDMALSDVSGTVAALKEQAEEYKHQLTRWMRTRGVKVETLGSDVANFDNPADAVITQIAGATGIPKRILTGSEMGELASSQDRENFRDKIIGRQLQYAGPYIVRQLVDRLIQFGFLPTPKGGPDEYQVKWPHIEVLTETEKVQGAQGMAAVNQTFGDAVFTDSEIRDKWFGMAPLTDEQRAELDDRADERAKKAQELMTEQQPPQTNADESDLDFNLDAEEELKAAEEFTHETAVDFADDELRTAASLRKKWEEAKHSRAKDGEFGTGAGTPAVKSPTSQRATQRTLKAGLTNLRLKLNPEEVAALEEAHQIATKAGFQGSQLEFMRQQLAIAATTDGDPVVQFDPKTIEAYQALRKASLDAGQSVAREQPTPAPAVSAKPAGAAKPAEKKAVAPPPKSKKTAAKAKDAKKASSAKSKSETDPLETLVEGMKTDERAALDEGFAKASRDGFKGTKIAFLREQLDLYETAEEGDKRIKTFFYSATIDAYKKIAKHRAAEGSPTYNLSSTQIQLPPVLAEALLAMGSALRGDDLCDEEGGLEDDPHITVKYGLHTNDVADVRRALATYVGPIRFTLGRTQMFQAPDYDVLYVEVVSPDLVALNARLSAALDNTSTQSIYIPHATVGYLKRGLGIRYVGMRNVEGMSATVGLVRFSPAEGDDVDLRITGRDEVNGQFAPVNQQLPLAAREDLYTLEKQEDVALLNVLATAIECGQTDVVNKIIGLK